uniref:Uncharacterized protein n=1 Tax=Rhizophora mucronata TaxID=61149 RepID=A0A2P2PGF7_RHIMU
MINLQPQFEKAIQHQKLKVRLVHHLKSFSTPIRWHHPQTELLDQLYRNEPQENQNKEFETVSA